MAKSLVRSFRRSAKAHGTRIIYRIAGLPIAIRALRHPPLGSPGKLVRSAYRSHYWTPGSGGDLVELVLGLLLAPIVVIGMMISFTARNGRAIKETARRSIVAQLGDQIWLYVKAGVLPPWYYIYELHRRPVKRAARSFIQRCECKDGVPALLKHLNPPASELTDKAEFSRWCEARAVPTVPVLAVVRHDGVDRLRSLDQLAADLFVKPVDGKGGRGAQRWDYLGGGRHRCSDGKELDTLGMLFAIAAEAWSGARLIQPRVRNHPELEPLNNGALATVRALTCLDEAGEPELLGAVLRMAIGDNQVVDNLHAGGIAAAVELQTGRLGLASNLGMDCSLGWLDRHPTSGAPIAGFELPHWAEFRSFTERAHRAFADRIMVGWDVAITPDGLILIEGNGAPDLDIMQRAYRRGWMTDRLGQL
ncbi:MAG TPA: sugar-transfer associated ATP-grasp domain-containing protein, partial [Sphingomicrobium sp.]